VIKGKGGLKVKNARKRLVLLTLLSTLLALSLLPLSAGVATAAGSEDPGGYDAASTSTLWYLAEGCTIGMETWVLVQNPNPDVAYVSIALYTEAGPVYPPALQNLPLSGRSRWSYPLNTYCSTYDVSTEVTSDIPVICERAMYGPERAWATDSIGVYSPNVVWFLAEGCTVGMETWVLVQNPYAVPTTVSLTLMTDTGTVNPPGLQNVALDGQSRKSFNLGNYVSSYDVSTRVDSPGGVIAERAMYGPGRRWATDSIGARTTATDWYLAEGCTAGGMETWILVQNPNAYDAEIYFDFCTDTGPLHFAHTFIIPAGHRQSFDLGAYLEDDYFGLGTKVHCISGDVICERAMYGPGREWATDSIGAANMDYEWYLAEGCTRSMETWVLVMNSGETPVNYSVAFMTESGAVNPPELQNVFIYPSTRASINVGNYVTSFDVSTQVTATDYNLVVERSMYGPGHQWATNSIGCSHSY
jgi:hypothetical protein